MTQTPQSETPADTTPAGVRLRELIDEVGSLLDRHDRRTHVFSTESERLGEAADLNRLTSRLLALQVAHLQALEMDKVCFNLASLSTSSWLSATQNLTPSRASALVITGRDLHRFPALEGAALSGEISVDQAVAVTKELRDLPDEFSPEGVERAQATMLEQCSTLNSSQLAHTAKFLLECEAPDTADALQEQLLANQLARADRERYLRFRHTGHGNTLIDGSLPTEQARAVETLLGTFAAEQYRRGIDRLDPYAELTNRPQRLADALVSVCERIQRCGDAPAHGGDRPRVMVTIGYDRLLGLASQGGVEVGSEQSLTPGELRRIICDADIAPVVLGGESEILDLGATHRLVTRPLRTALTLRDRGCAFPGCDKLPVDCDAHHVLPWVFDGPTELSNLVLLCRHHHTLVEPRGEAGLPLAHQWKFQIRTDSGLPEVIPPPQVDKRQRRRLHQRFKIADDPDAEAPQLRNPAA